MRDVAEIERLTEGRWRSKGKIGTNAASGPDWVGQKRGITIEEIAAKLCHDIEYHWSEKDKQRFRQALRDDLENTETELQGPPKPGGWAGWPVATSCSRAKIKVGGYLVNQARRLSSPRSWRGYRAK